MTSSKKKVGYVKIKKGGRFKLSRYCRGIGQLRKFPSLQIRAVFMTNFLGIRACSHVIS